MSSAEKLEHPKRELIVVQAPGREFTVSKLAFGPGSYLSNIERMSGTYLDPAGNRISFEPTTVSESI